MLGLVITHSGVWSKLCLCFIFSPGAMHCLLIMKGGPGSFGDTEYRTNKAPKPLSGLPYAGVLVQQLMDLQFQS
uniref:Uncharacterized protein n=1 Tax=Setaria viridis TaxID=4556 RepID=A0A4U6WCI0_SETVI|nr:hypothetical protein SEVIR_1G177950v2 [Setaria viridis]